MNRLVLIDSHAIIHRAYHALPPMHTPSGQQTNAVYGFTNMLLRAIDDIKPTYLIAAFDLPAPTFRHKEYIAYQAQRPASEQEMRSQIQIVKDTVKAAGIPAYEQEGFEADDIIGTLARLATKNSNCEVIILTGDRDMLQLVNKKVKVYAPIKGLTETTIFDEKKTKEHLGLATKQIIDYKALTGDSSDNYPGVPGIGPKTALALLEKFGSLENIYKKLEKAGELEGFSNAVTKRLKEGKNSGLLSQKLARIVTSVPIKLNLKKAKLNDLSKDEKFLSHLRALGFKSIVKRLTGEEPKKVKKKSNGQIGLL